MTNETPQNIPKKSDKDKAKDKESVVNIWMDNLESTKPDQPDEKK